MSKTTGKVKDTNSKKDKTKKSEETRAKITESALALFRSKGFEETTMRLISKEAGVALGTIYIYYASKEEIVLEYYTNVQNLLYEEIQAELFGPGGAPVKNSRPAPVDISSAKAKKAKPLAASLELLFTRQLEALQGDQGFLSGLAGAAASGSAISPFSAESEPVRKMHLAFFEEIIAHSKEKVDPELAKELVSLLWMLQMGLIFFWIHDKSKNSRESFELVASIIELLGAMLKLLNNPLFYTLKKELIKLTRRLMRIVENG